MNKCCMTANSLVELMRIAYQIGSLWEKRWSPAPMRLWFRGVSNEKHTLNPGLLRGSLSPEDAMKLEHQIASDFKIRGRPYFSSEMNNPWDAMFLMQHYGFHTRLLDWAESLIVAAYFSAREVDSTTDGAVWVLAPQFLISKQYNNEGTYLYAGHEYIKDYKICGPWENLDEFNKKIPMPVFPTHLDQRIVAQRGRFTIHTFIPNMLEKLSCADTLENRDAAFLQKIYIPAEAKPTIRQQCQIFGGVSEETIYPDLEGLARSMRFELKEDNILP